MSGLGIAIIGSAALALAECGAVLSITAKHFPKDLWPVDLFVSAVGKAGITHTLFWCPLMAVCATVRWACLRRRTSPGPEPFLAAVFIALAGFVVLPTDLGLANIGSLAAIVAACIGAMVLAVAIYVLLRVMRSKLGEARFRRVVNVTVSVSALVIIASGVVFVRSPLFNPGTYQVPHSTVEHATRSRPNVLWIVFDTLRADRMSCYGYAAPTTPFLEDWATKSIVFDRAVSNGIWTVPGHASMFTGRSVREHGVDFDNLWLDDTITTVADVLTEQGYTTASFANNPWLTNVANLVHGFESWRYIRHDLHLSRFSLEQICEKWGITPLLPWLDPDFGAAITNHLIARWLDMQADDDAPLFLFVNYMEAHSPYRVPKHYRKMYMTNEQVDRSYDLRWCVYGNLIPALSMRFNIEGPEFLAPTDREILKRQYEATLQYLDYRAGELIGMFEQRGLLNDTLVIITGDHGEYLDTHGLWEHRFLAYEDVTHVPLLVREPARKTGLRISVPAQLSDLYPTVLNAALGTDNPGPGYDSRDLVALAAGDDVRRIAISEYNGPTPTKTTPMRARGEPAGGHRDHPQITAQDGRFKYIASADGQRELYDLLNDPGELHNLIDTKSAEAKRLAAYIDQWYDAVPAYQPSCSDDVPTMDPDVLEALRSLGYLGN